VLDENGLPAAIGDHVRELCGLAGLRSEVDLADVDGLERHTQTMLYRIVQESLTNVVRHAEATGVRVTLGLDGDGGGKADGGAGAVRLSIHDDGRGFDTAKIAGLVREGHFGLAGMRERVGLAGGTMTVESPDEGGTTITVLVPRRIPENGGTP
jgi:two-component system NarL family sensor kinase